MKRTQILVLTAILAAAGALLAGAQSRALPSGDVQAIYQRLLEKIKSIKIFDHHAHPGYGDDSDVDAQATPPQHLPFRERDTNPELVAAVKALFDYPYADLSKDHMGWLQERSSAAEKAGGTRYWDHVLDQCGIEPSVANRVAMIGYLNPKRFRWVFSVDSFLLPFDNKTVIAENPDEGVYIPLQEKVLRRYMQQASIGRLPNSFDEYLVFITRILEENQKKGSIAEKFEAGYFRSLYFADPPRPAAAAVYQKYYSGILFGRGPHAGGIQDIPGLRFSLPGHRGRPAAIACAYSHGGGRRRLFQSAEGRRPQSGERRQRPTLSQHHLRPDPRRLSVFQGSDLAGVDEECVHRYVGDRNAGLPFGDEECLEAVAGNVSREDYVLAATRTLSALLWGQRSRIGWQSTRPATLWRPLWPKWWPPTK
jgi:hypothetical protein